MKLQLVLSFFLNASDYTCAKLLFLYVLIIRRHTLFSVNLKSNKIIFTNYSGFPLR